MGENLKKEARQSGIIALLILRNGVFNVKNEKEKILRSLLGRDVEDFDSDTLIKLLSEHVSVDIDEEMNAKASVGERAADKLAAIAGSWGFVIGFVTFLLAWIVLNAFILISSPPDPYPFILLNLVLSCVAAIQAPIIMMSQNRQSAKDSLRSKNDYKTNIKSELMLELMFTKIDEMNKEINKLSKEINKLSNRS